MAEISGHRGSRAARGKALSSDKIEALIWGLKHPNAAVRRCSLELLDQHPDESAIPSIIECLSDPVARVRWHAIHALECDVCKQGASFFSPHALETIQRLAASDPSDKVRQYAERVVREHHAA
jgi:HEAT repeat protein